MRTLRLVPLVAVAALSACGGPARPHADPRPTPPTSDAGAKPAGPAALAPLGALPPMAVMPKPGVVGSRKVEVRDAPALASCASAGRPAKDPDAEVKRIGEACASASKMKPAAPPIRGTQADKDAHQEHKVKVARGRCVRAYLAAAEGARDVVVVARDDAGDIIAESNGPGLPESGSMCFREDGELSLLVGVGTGKAAYALQVWTD